MDELDPYSKLYARTRGAKDDMALAAKEHRYESENSGQDMHGLLHSMFEGLGRLAQFLTHSHTIHIHRPHHTH